MIGENDEEFLQYIVKKAHIDKNSRIIDLGCGSGYVVGSLHNTCDIIGISTSPECIKQCEISCPDARFTVGNMENYQRKECTHLLSLESLGYADITKTFHNAFLNLKKGGIFYIKELCQDFKENQEERENREYWEYYWKYKVYKITDIIQIAQEAGFTLFEYQNLSHIINSSMFRDSLQYNKAAYRPPHPSVLIRLVPTEFVFRK